MTGSTTTATTSTANVSSSPNVHYTVAPTDARTFTVVPHEPSPR